MPAKTKHSGSPLYATYVQATRKNSMTGKTSRKQWIVFPPLPENLAKTANMSGTDMMLEFHREQPTLENRVKWQHSFVDPGLIQRDLAEKIQALYAYNVDMPSEFAWQVAGPLVCQVSVSEMATLIKEPSTPYFALKRFEKIAKRQLGLSI